MIHIPKVIEIGGISYPVNFVKEIPGRAAQINFYKGVIEIDENMGDEVVFVSFIHEIVHGINSSLNHHPNEMIYNDENYTESFAQILTSIVKQVVEYNIFYEEYHEFDGDFDVEEDKEQSILNIEELDNFE